MSLLAPLYSISLAGPHEQDPDHPEIDRVHDDNRGQRRDAPIDEPAREESCPPRARLGGFTASHVRVSTIEECVGASGERAASGNSQ